MAIRRTFDDDWSNDEQAGGGAGGYGGSGPVYNDTRFGGYGGRVEMVPGADGELHPEIVGTSRGDYVSRYRGLGAATANRQAYQIDYSQADQDRARGLQAREGQVQAAGLMRDAALGNAPSRAEIMSQGGVDAGMHSQLSAQGRGLAGAAYAQRQAMQQGQQQQLGAIGQTTAQRADELGSAQDAYTRGASSIRNGDYASQYQMQQQARQQMLMELEQRQRNQQQQEEYEKLALGVNKAEMEADLAKRQGFLQRDAANQAAANAGKARQDQLIGATLGAGGAAGSAAIRSPGTPDPGDGDTSSDVRAKSHAYMLSDDRTKLAEAYQLGKAHAAASISTGKQVPSAYEPGDAVLKPGRAASKIRGNAMATEIAQQPQVTTQEEVNQSSLARAQLAAQRAAQHDAQMAPETRSTSERYMDRAADAAGGAYGSALDWWDAHVSDERAKSDVKRTGMGAALARGLAPYEYEYKPGFREQEEQAPGEKNVGPMAQNMASNPVTGTAVKRGENGLLYIDMPKATKLSLGGIGYLAAQQREQEERLRRLEKGRG